MVDRDGQWSTLQFEEVALAEFRFLLTEYGFALVAADSSNLSFERDNVRVVVRQDRESFELRVTVERKDTGERFSVWEIARLQGAPDITEQTFLQATAKEHVQILLPELAGLLRTYGQSVLRGDSETLLRLRAQQIEESNRFLREGRVRWVRERLPAIWEQHDYVQVVKLLEEVRDQLSPSELAKLDYARRHLT